MLPLIAALAIAGASPEGGPVLDVDGLRKLALTLRAHPTVAQPARFRIELPLVSDKQTTLDALQNPIGWSYDRIAERLTLDVDLGAVTPQNYKPFEAQGLYQAPPLRVLYFSAETTNGRGDPVIIGTSYGLAIATSAQAHGLRGGDLPDDFTLPFVVQVRAKPYQVAQLVRSLRLRVEGELRTVVGRAVLCGDSFLNGYTVDRFTEKSVQFANDYMCLTPAVVTRFSLVSTTGGPPLHEWRRASATPLAETAETAVMSDREPSRAILGPGDPLTTTTTSALPPSR